MYDNKRTINIRRLTMQAIEVKFYVDNNGNSKVVAKSQAGKVHRFRDQVRELNRDVQLSYSILNDEERIGYLVALELARKFHWDWSENYGDMVIGRLASGDLVFVFTGRDNCNVIK
jgi:hypothetical protein